MGKLIKDNKCLEDGMNKKEVETLVQSKVNAGLAKGVTGVKGNSETTYRTGNVNLTPANIGAMPAQGGTLTGDMQTKNVYPALDRTNSCGNESHIWSHVYTNELNLPFGKLYYSGTATVLAVFERLTIRDNTNVDNLMPFEAGEIKGDRFIEPSSRRYKENIELMTEEEANKILDIDVVTFDYINKANGVNRRGVIAEDVYEKIPSVVSLAEIDGEMVPDAVGYSNFVPYLIKEMQMMDKRLKKLENKN